MKPIEIRDDVIRTRPKLVRTMRWVMWASLLLYFRSVKKAIRRSLLSKPDQASTQPE